MNNVPHKTWWTLFFLTILVYVAGMFPDIMDVDAAQYASVSLEMLQRGNLIRVFHHGANYLDKPPLLFWLNAVSFKVFGFSNFAYRLPSVLVTLLGLYSTFRLASSVYDRETGRIAAIILGTTQAFFLFNNDIRTDTLLTGFVIFTIWQLWSYINSGKMIHLIAGSVGIGLSMLSKGPIGLMVPVLALLPEIIVHRRYTYLLRWRTLTGIGIVALVLAPMLAGLYMQYGSRGFYFFFWLQSFGRITGENKWDNNPGMFFLSHSFLWSFLPWSLLAIVALVGKVRDAVKGLASKKLNTEILTVCGFLIPFMVLSASRYQLPHYIFVLYPLAAIFTAATIVRWMDHPTRTTRAFVFIQAFLGLVYFVAAILISAWLFPGMGFLLWMALLLLMGITLWQFMIRQAPLLRLVVTSALAAIAFNLVMNLHFYPAILQYQAGSVAARWVKTRQIPVDHLALFRSRNLSFEVYLQAPDLPMLMDTLQAGEALQRKGKLWLYTDDNGLELLQRNRQIAQVVHFDEFHCATLTWKFLNPATREQSLKNRFLVELKTDR